MKPNCRQLALLLSLACLGARADNVPRNDEGTVYVPIGKRDPFKRPSAGDNNGRDVSAINPLEKFGLEQFQLRAILRGTATAQAMFEDPEGRVHIVNEGTLIGRERGTVSRILNREVIVTERTVNYLGVTSLFERVLSLPAEDDVDQGGTAAPVKGGKTKSGASTGGGGAPSDNQASNTVIRTVTQERSVAPAAAPPAAPAGNGFANIKNFGAAPPAPPPAASSTVRGGSGKGLAY